MMTHHIEAAPAEERAGVARIRSNDVGRGHNNSNGRTPTHFVHIHARIEVRAHPGVYYGEAFLQRSF